MSNFWIIIAILILIVIVIFLSRSSGSSNYLESSLISTLPSSSQNPGDSGEIVLPLWWDSPTGSFKTRIRLGDSTRNIPFNVIPDTGSNVLILSGPNCTGCDSSDGVWDTSLGQSVGKIGIVTYGGGQKTTYLQWNGLLYNNSGSTTSPSNPSSQVQSVVPVNFGVVTSSNTPEGSPQNVLGLQPKGFLSSLAKDGKPPKITFDFIRGYLTISNSQESRGTPMSNFSDGVISAPASKSFSLVDYPESTDDIKFISSKITAMSINGQQVPDNVMPHYALFDTGTTFTIVSQKMFNYLQQSSNLPKGSSVSLTFQSGQTGTTVVFRPPANSIRQEPLKDDDTLLIGNLWLRDHIFTIDYPNNRMTLS